MTVRLIRRYWIAAAVFMMASLLFVLIFSQPTSAAQTVPYKINFQGRLTGNDGNIVPDGQYNMQYRIYNAPTGGAVQWNELREAGNRVQVTNGLFAVQLGDITPIDPTLFTTQDLYFEVELPSPATATCATASCASFTEGPMTPRQKLAASPYAINADMVDGIDGQNIAVLNSGNQFTAGQTINTNSTNALNVQTGGNSLLLADTTNNIVKVGTSSNPTLANVRLISTSAEFTGSVRIGNATNGVDISAANGVLLNGTARRTKNITIPAEYAGAVLDAGTMSANSGAMTAGFDLTNRMNYYNWTTSAGSNQTYDVVVQVPIPSDFSAWANTTPISVAASTSNLTNGTIAVEARDSAGAVVPGINFNLITPTTVNTWQTRNAGTISGTYTAGEYMTLRLRMQAGAGNNTRIGNINLTYLSRW